jgi:hypothetical protein
VSRIGGYYKPIIPMPKAQPTPVVKRDEQNPEPVELIAKSIIDVADAARKMMASPLKIDAIVLLLHHSIGVRNITQYQIKQVLLHAAALKTNYLK